MDTWAKAWHLIAMVTWFAAIFYLPRLFVYHAMSDDQTSNERFKIMERKLYNGIMTPSMVITLIFGFWMLYDYAWAVYGKMGWLHAKLALIAILVGYHFYCGKLLKDFKHDRNTKSHVWYRWFNEVPVILLIVIILLAVRKPF
ncbi:MAG: protoporphyrinogen oxidase HemJ [Gammaproteobacteria bacterium]|jgi:protoporphyrinogen IX oxidase